MLDIDGVLNTKATMGYSMIESKPIENLNHIIYKTNAKIVLSSSWRYIIYSKLMTLDGFEIMLKTHGFIGRRSLIDITCRDESYFDRWFQVETWLKQNQEKVESFVILDDAEEFANFPNNFIKTNPSIGLTKIDAEKAVLILNK